MNHFLHPASLLATLLSAATQVAAHGHVSNVVINGVSYAGWDINSYPYMEDPPVVIAWETPNTGNGFITPSEYESDDIICHRDAQNARGHAVVAAGDRINIQWTPWPETHHGPVITYLANCGESCETVDKTTLEFFKISGVGLADGSNPPGVWGDDLLIENNNSWLVEIPSTIAPGYYVLRNELIALHGAHSKGGAQNYPQCFNLQVTSPGSASPAGVLGTDLYTPTDPGVLVDIYQSLPTYNVPGPTPIPGAVSVEQSSSSITASGTPITGSATGGGGGGDSSPTATTTAQQSTVVTPTITTTTKPTATTPTATPAPGGTSRQSVHGQCGGNGWTGPTVCSGQATCTSYNDWYSQCVPT